MANICYRMNKWLALCFWCLSISALLPLNATRADTLYQAEVSAGQSQQQWQKQALEQVIVKVTGQQIKDLPQLQAALNQPAAYVKQFEALGSTASGTIRVFLDAQRIHRLLQEHSVPVWGVHRPTILFWIISQDGVERGFVRSPEDPLLQSLQQQLRQQAIPFILPLYDIDDIMQLTETDVWAGFWQQINQASQRYKTDIVMTVVIDSVTVENKQLWRLNWQRQHNGRVLRYEITETDKEQLITSFISALSSELVQQYAVLLSAGTTSHQLDVENVETLADIVQLEKMLQSVLGVTDVTVAEFSKGRARFSVNSQISAAQLLTLLQFEKSLQVVIPSGDLSAQNNAKAIAVFRYTGR